MFIKPNNAELMAGCISFMYFRFLSVRLSRVCFGHLDSYKNAKVGIREEWDVRFGSSVHAFLATTISVLVILLDQEAWQDPLWGQSRGAKSVLMMTVGYLMADTLLMLDYAYHLGESTKSYIGHHLVTAAVMLVCTLHEAFLPLVVFRNIAELSTIFVNNRWVFEACEMKTTKIYVINGIIMAFSFFLVRILPMPYIYVAFYRHSETYFRMGYVALFPTAGVILDILNTFWFYKIMLGMTKYIKRQLKQEKPKET